MFLSRIVKRDRCKAPSNFARISWYARYPHPQKQVALRFVKTWNIRGSGLMRIRQAGKVFLLIIVSVICISICIHLLINSLGMVCVFKWIFDVSIVNISKPAFSIIFIRCLLVMVRHFIYFRLFVVFRHPIKVGMVKKHDVKTLVTGTVFGGYFNVRDKLIWEFKLFQFDRIEMMLEYKISVCVIRVW